MPQSLPVRAPLAELAEISPLIAEIAPATVDPESAALQPLVQRTCMALQAMAASLEALESVFLRMETLEPHACQHPDLIRGTQDTVSHVIALLRREGPPLLFRAQALRLRLRLHGYAAGTSATLALRTLHTDLDGLAAYKHERAPRTVLHWAPHIRRARANTLIMLSEFDCHARQIEVQLSSATAS